ncbi:hypothetical protein RLOatenuis_6370 [Rickettsiales bacterium]|nr:hypothetical protein RLOatenuis_6370 [Rickettsiales bacterium]
MPLTKEQKIKILEGYFDLLVKIGDKRYIPMPENWLHKMSILKSLVQEEPEITARIEDDLIAGAVEDIINCNSYICIALKLDKSDVNSEVKKVLHVYYNSLKTNAEQGHRLLHVSLEDYFINSINKPQICPETIISAESAEAATTQQPKEPGID